MANKATATATNYSHSINLHPEEGTCYKRPKIVECEGVRRNQSYEQQFVQEQHRRDKQKGKTKKQWLVGITTKQTNKQIKPKATPNRNKQQAKQKNKTNQPWRKYTVFSYSFGLEEGSRILGKFYVNT